MSKVYGKRPGMSGVDTGARRVASTYGKESFLTHGKKSGGLMVVEQEAERLAAHMLTLDPEVVEVWTQPFMVDLVNGTVLRSADERREAWAQQRGKKGARFYTPDFLVRLSGGIERAVEVKLEGYLGDERYQQKLEHAERVLWANGYEFARPVVPRSSKHPLRTNVPLLHQASLHDDLMPGPEVCEEVARLANQGAITLADYCAGLGMSANMTPVLLAFGALRMDLHAHPIRGSAPAEPAFGSLDHLQLLWSLSV